MSVDYIPLPVTTLEVLAKLTVELTKLKQNLHSSERIEDVAPIIWKRLLEATFPAPMLMKATSDVRV